MEGQLVQANLVCQQPGYFYLQKWFRLSQWLGGLSDLAEGQPVQANLVRLGLRLWLKSVLLLSKEVV